MTLKPFKRIPVFIAFGVILVICLVRLLEFKFIEQVECMTFDMRVREALRFAHPVATNLGFVYLDEKSIRSVQNRLLGQPYGLYWPRHVYGRLTQELAAQGVKAIAFDVIFAELRGDHNPVRMADGRAIDSDEFFGLQMARASNVILAVSEQVILPRVFLTNAAALGDISTDKDSDGVLRRAKAFRQYRRWHPAFQQVGEDPELGIDLRQARFERRQIILTGSEGKRFNIPLDADGNFDVTDFGGESLPPGMARKAKPFAYERVWHMGVVLAARELGLDLARAEIDLDHGRIVLPGAPGVERIIPVDKDGYFYIDWCIPPRHPQLAREPIHTLLSKGLSRLRGETNDLHEQWQGKLAVIGSTALGNDLTDRGATPLEDSGLFVSKHWNVANSIITNRFVQRAPLFAELGLIAIMGILAAVLTWEMRALVGFGSVILMGIVYIVFSTVVYIQTRYWLPIVLPLIGGLVAMYFCILAWRLVFEEAQRRRTRSLFSKVVSPKIVKELEDKAEDLQALSGARREITVLFADVRGFTELTDTSQERVADFVRQNSLTGGAAEACFNEQARETLETVNLYLASVADIIIKRDGLLDKFIGDCVMAFWGAPTSNAKHASACVRAAIEAQRAIEELNQQRARDNERRELENRARLSAGLPAKSILPLLLLGTGINTGRATVGLMGSLKGQQSYTAFGREVNLASRLEGASGRGRIFIGETTYQHLRREDPELAATCAELPLTELKGFRSAIKAYEVPWRLATPSTPVESSTTGTTSFTGLIQRDS